MYGEPGIGKSALLEEAVAESAGMTVLRATGIEMEAELAFAGLDELVRPVAGLIGRLPPVQARALRTALSLAEGPAPDQLTLGAATLTLLTDAAATTPVLVAVDDAHWLDEASTHALLFAFRRLQAEAVAVLITARNGEGCRFTEAHLPALTLAGLAPAAAAALVQRVAAIPTDSELFERLHRETAGNPLALLEAARTLRTCAGAAQEPDGPLPVGPRLTAAHAARLATLPEPSRRAATVAAAGYSGEASVLVAALHDLGLDSGALQALEAAKVLDLSGGKVRFVHPLLRAAAYHTAGPEGRREAHRALARALADTNGPANRDQWSWHLAAAAAGPDACAASALGETAARARDRGALPAALRAYERAADLAPLPVDQGRYLLAAAEVAQLAGRGDRALVLADAATRTTDDAAVRAGAAGLRSQILLVRQPPRRVHDQLVDMASGLEAAQAAPLLVAAAGAACMGGAILQARVTADRAFALSRTGETAVFDHSAAVMRAHTMMLAGERREAAAVLGHCEEFLTATDPLSIGVEVTSFSAMDLMWLERFSTARTLLERAVRCARRIGASERLVPYLTVLADTQLRTGYWDDAYASASEGAALAGEIGQPVLQAYAISTLARMEAAQGRAAECLEHARQFRELLRGRGAELVSPYMEAALGLLELGTGKDSEAAARLNDLQQQLVRVGLREPTVLQHQSDLIEACLAAGDASGARATLAELAGQVQQAPSRWGLAVSARCRGLVEADEDAYAEALRHHEQLPDPFAKARTELAYGRFLRRQRKRGAARRPLIAARRTFERLRADPWTALAERELRAAGFETPIRRSPEPFTLTERETQVAALVIKGHTNREVAATLFLSEKTVEYHLRRIYTKLSVRSRVELARCLAIDARRA
ncbi:transcriptional regulator [Streptomyces djakartensis]|uniref:Transcriptional regulator n=1 Tax=Streptomyces djakartensis TaxID=68193 RepID=A0ABQ2Z3P7_9ACTN|nr:transcriptional regulator [Streptomyces djakartensis]